MDWIILCLVYQEEHIAGWCRFEKNKMEILVSMHASISQTLMNWLGSHFLPIISN